MKLELVLDHIGVGVRDLDRGREAYARLGFALTPRSVHRGSLTPGGPVVAWGSANHCAMFDEGYLEIIGPLPAGCRPAPFGIWSNGMKARTSWPSAARIRKRFTRRSASSACPCSLHGCWRGTRLTALPGTKPGLRRSAMPCSIPRSSTRAGLFYIQHLTPDVLWQPHQLAQPNGVVALREIYFCAPGAEAVAAKFAPMLRSVPEKHGPGEWRLPLVRGAARILEPDAWNRLAPDQPTPEPPAPVGIGFQVSSLDRARDHIEANGIVFRDGALPWVGANDACGTVLFFSEE